MVLMLGFLCIPAYSTIKDYSVLGKSIDSIRSLRVSAVSIESQIKISETKLNDIIDSTTMQNDKQDILLLKTKITNALVSLNDLVSTIDTLYPDIK